MPDRFTGHAAGLESPATHGFALTPNDATDIAEVTRAIFVGGSGALSLVMASGAEIVLAGVGAGTVLPLRIRRVKATGTTATALVGLL